MFLDCEGPNCDDEYFRTHIPWVSWVRDQTDAGVHVIVTSQATGAGGREYRIDLTGREALSDYEDQVLYRSLSTDTERETLDGLIHTLSLALARYADAAGYRDLVSVEGRGGGRPGQDRLVAAGDVEDPWDLWVFRINASGNLDGEETQETRRFNSSVSASRVTPTWKMDYDARISYTRQEFERSDSSLFVDTRTDWNLDGLVVYSLAEHWSVGANVRSGRLNRFNQDFRLEVRPAVEWSYYPYPEATRHSLTAFYEVGPTYRNYMEETVFGEVAETRWEHSLELEFSQRQTWGEASLSVAGSHLLDDFEKNNLSIRGNVDFRIVRGLSINARGNIGWVNDQIYLSSEGETDEEILLRLRQRGTDFSYGLNLGFSYQFGSIYNNVVNNRFGGGGDMGFMFRRF